MKTILLEGKDISFSYNNRCVLDSINFKILKGSFVSFIGPSGCGKTTLLNIFAGLLHQDNGVLEYTNPLFSLVLQKNSLLPWLTLQENVLIPYSIKKEKISKAEQQQKVLEIIDLVGLKGFESHFPSELSGGMCKRAELARGLIEHNELIILDEPFSSLDIISRERLNILLHDICIKTNCTILLVTHSIEEACYLSDEIFVMGNVPATIIHHEIVSKESHSNDAYILSEQEQLSERTIRTITSEKWSDKSNDTAVVIVKKEKKISGRGLFTAIFSQFLIVFFLLSIIKFTGKIPDFYFPYPHSVLIRFISTLIDGSIFIHLFTTMIESLTGFFIAFFITLITGYIISVNKVLYKWLMPSLIASNTIPSIAIAPILITWFGFGITPKIVISVIIVFFPMLINNITAFTDSRKKYRDLITIYSPDIFYRLLKIEIPGALPQIITGVKVSSTLSVIGAVVGEFMAGSTGLGSLINTAKNSIDYEMMFVPIIYLVILGFVYYSISSIIYDIVSKNH